MVLQSRSRRRRALQATVHQAKSNTCKHSNSVYDLNDSCVTNVDSALYHEGHEGKRFAMQHADVGAASAPRAVTKPNICAHVLQSEKGNILKVAL